MGVLINCLKSLKFKQITTIHVQANALIAMVGNSLYIIYIA